MNWVFTILFFVKLLLVISFKYFPLTIHFQLNTSDEAGDDSDDSSSSSAHGISLDAFREKWKQEIVKDVKANQSEEQSSNNCEDEQTDNDAAKVIHISTQYKKTKMYILFRLRQLNYFCKQPS